MIRNRKNQKKALSPVVSEVILIALAVALGAFVLIWGEDFMKENQGTAEDVSAQKQQCLLIELEFKNISYNARSERDSAKLNITLELKSELGINITDISILILNEQGDSIKLFASQSTNQVFSGFFPAYIRGIDRLLLGYDINRSDFNDMNISDISVTPIINHKSINISCVDQTIKINKEEQIFELFDRSE
ncbi:hypothetical protein DRJ17_04865 [Candidatus Woesearchaeota archaeon]|nr:MAG: hypothetical protein DRJ17_04865 [Candidatus Woesearchaeota archaeon]